MFIVKFNTRNVAFEDGYEIPRILREVADKIENGKMADSIFDINGNKIGVYGFK